MKILILLFIASMNLKAVEITFIGPCDEDFIMKENVSEAYRNVGELTIGTLKKFNIPFIGTPEGISSIFETPIGDEYWESPRDPVLPHISDYSRFVLDGDFTYTVPPPPLVPDGTPAWLYALTCSGEPTPITLCFLTPGGI